MGVAGRASLMVIFEGGFPKAWNWKEGSRWEMSPPSNSIFCASLSWELSATQVPPSLRSGGDLGRTTPRQVHAPGCPVACTFPLQLRQALLQGGRWALPQKLWGHIGTGSGLIDFRLWSRSGVDWGVDCFPTWERFWVVLVDRFAASFKMGLAAPVTKLFIVEGSTA